MGQRRSPSSRDRRSSPYQDPFPPALGGGNLPSSASPSLCIAVMGSMTRAMQAEEALSRAAIRSTVVKVSSSAHNGCAYGVEFPCIQKENLQSVLHRANLSVRDFR